MRKTVAEDLVAGSVVFLVAVPLCLGIALASGAPLFSGMIAGIIGGIVVGFISKSPLSVSGPAAGLTAICLSGIKTLGSYEAFLLAVFLAGIIQIILAVLKAGTIAYYFPSSVIKGMLVAIGIIIIIKQVPHFIGFDEDHLGNSYFSDLDGDKNFEILYKSLGHIHLGVALTGILSILSLIFWDKLKPKSLKLIPGALVCVITGLLTNSILASFFPSLAIEAEHLVSLPLANTLNDFFLQFTRPDFSQISNPDVWFVALTLGVVASIETLLTIEATDKIDPWKRVSPTDRELIAQGVGNTISGLIGGLPITSVIVRSSANINAGGKNKTATIFHGTLMLLGVMFFAKFLNLIPLTSLAAILLVTGYKLANPKVFKELYKLGISQSVPFIITVIAVVTTNLLTGVMIGIAISACMILYINLKNTYHFHKEDYHDGEYITLVLSPEVTFLNKAAIRLTLDDIPKNSNFLIDASRSTYIDYDVMELIKEFEKEKAPTRNIKLTLKGFKDSYCVTDTNHIFFSSDKTNIASNT